MNVAQDSSGEGSYRGFLVAKSGVPSERLKVFMPGDYSPSYWYEVDGDGGFVRLWAIRSTWPEFDTADAADAEPVTALREAEVRRRVEEHARFLQEHYPKS